MICSLGTGQSLLFSPPAEKNKPLPENNIVPVPSRLDFQSWLTAFAGEMVLLHIRAGGTIQNVKWADISFQACILLLPPYA